MNIKRLEIYGYGKWIDQVFDFDETLQLVYGQNEAGKSTVQSFIRSMLFGFPSKRRRVNQQNRYEPKENERYGGRLLLGDTPYGDIWIERTSKQFQIQQVDGTVLPERVLEEVLAGLDEKMFDSFYAFNLQNLQELSNVGTDQLNDYFMSIGTIGSDQFLKIAKAYQKETDEMFRPTAQNRPLNVLLNEYDELAKRVVAMQQQMARYSELVARKTQAEEAIAGLNETIQTLEKELRDLDKLVGRYDVYLKDRAAVRELEHLIYTDVPENSETLLNDALKADNAAALQLVQLEERTRNLQGELGSLTKLNWAKNHEDERRQWVPLTAKAKEQQLQVEQLNARIEELKQQMTQLADQGQFFPEKVEDTPEYQLRFEEGLTIQAQKVETLKQLETIKAERKVYLEQRKEQQNYSATVRQQVVHLEHQRMNEEAQLMHETRLNRYFLGLLFFIIGMIVTLTQSFVGGTGQSILWWLGIIITFMGTASMGYIFNENRKRYAAFHNSPVLEKIQDLKEKEQQFHEQGKALGIQINEREAMVAQLEAQLAMIGDQQVTWLNAIGFYPTADPELILKANPVKHYFRAQIQQEELKEKRAIVMEAVQHWRATVQPLFERFPLVEDDIRQQIRHVEETEVSLVRTVERGENIQQRISDANQQMTTIQSEMAQRAEWMTQLFADTYSEDAVDFFKKMSINRRIDELKEKHLLYQEQLEGYESQLSEIENKQQLLERYHRLEHQVDHLKARVQPHHHERADLAVEIQHLEQDGTYQQLVQQLALKETQVKELVYEWGSKRMAMQLIFNTLRQGLENPVPEMNDVANEIFETLSYGRYTHIKFNKSGVKVRQFSGIYFEPHELSQGTLEQLYVALRLAFVEKVQTMVKMPIMIDDAFVNFDERRKQSMYRVLQQVSQRMQVIFFTFDPKASAYFQELPQIHLETAAAAVQEEAMHETL